MTPQEEQAQRLLSLEMERLRPVPEWRGGRAGQKWLALSPAERALRRLIEEIELAAED